LLDSYIFKPSTFLGNVQFEVYAKNR
jgi:hypothetical protein